MQRFSRFHLYIKWNGRSLPFGSREKSRQLVIDETQLSGNRLIELTRGKMSKDQFLNT
jgi:hypothetical protein